MKHDIGKLKYGFMIDNNDDISIKLSIRWKDENDGVFNKNYKYGIFHEFNANAITTIDSQRDMVYDYFFKNIMRPLLEGRLPHSSLFIREGEEYKSLKELI